MLTIISIIILAKLWTVVCQPYPNPLTKHQYQIWGMVGMVRSAGEIPLVEAEGDGGIWAMYA